MQQKIAWERHDVVFQDHRYILQGIALLFRSQRLPFGKVEMLASLVNVVGDNPRDGGHVAIERPAGFVGVAIVAGSFENGPYRYRHGGDPSFRWIVSLDRHQLGREQYHGEDGHGSLVSMSWPFWEFGGHLWFRGDGRVHGVGLFP